MKKILVAVAVSMLASTAAFAGITNTKHDLSAQSTASIKNNETSQICVFCHTPHNATVNVPLWNRSNPNSTYRLYTTSATLTSATKASTLTSTSISLLCLSCHDGDVDQLGSRVQSLPIDALGGISMTDSTATYAQANGAVLGSDLTNDHPIGFNYNVAAGIDTTGLYSKSNANTNLNATDAFYGDGKNTMECSSCHLVHDDTNTPFLRKTNAGSQLCLACHSK